MPVKLPKYNEDLFKDSTMTFGEHLEELRRCLFMALLGLVVGFLIGLWFADRVVQFIQTPLERALVRYYKDIARDEATQRKLPYQDQTLDEMIRKRGLLFDEVLVDPAQMAEFLRQVAPDSVAKLPPAPPGEPKLLPLRLWRHVEDDSRIRPKTFASLEPFMIYVKAALLFGGLVSSPWVFYWLWTFVAAGLYPHEKSYIYIFLPFSLGLFFLGAAVAFFLVFDPVLDFLLSYNRWLGMDHEPRISEWLSFVLILPLGFGISFQLPLVMLFLERIGIFDVPTYLSRWRVSVLVIFFVAMILTPADPYSMVLMAVPLTGLYFVGVALCKYMPRGPGLLPPLEE